MEPILSGIEKLEILEKPTSIPSFSDDFWHISHFSN